MIPNPTHLDGAGHTTIKVRFHELDPYGHVNHGVYLNYFEAARIEVLDALGFGLDVLRQRGIHLVVVEAAIRFRHPAYAGDVITIHSWLSQLRRASCTWHQQMTRGDDVLAEVDVRSAAVTPDGRPTAAPADLVETLRALHRPPT